MEIDAYQEKDYTVVDKKIALMNLKPRDQLVLDCYMGGMTCNEIAEFLDIDRVTVWRRRQRAQVTIEEEYALLQEIKRNPTVYNQAFAFIMYTGLRRSELASVVTTTVYTHFQERSELQIVEIQKYDYKYN